MGLFSFLGGRKDEGLDREAPVPPAAQPGGPAPEPSAPRAGSPAAAPIETAASESPFAAPGEWTLDALTAPVEAPAASTPEIGEPDASATAELQGPIIEVLKTVYDPEIPVDIYELGLIYEIVVDAAHRVLVKMTLTSPACPSAQQLPSEVRYKVKAVPGVTEAWVDVVWEPPWDKDRMSEAARLQLGFF
jgi:FeS assembly SUF system protein